METIKSHKENTQIKHERIAIGFFIHFAIVASSGLACAPKVSEHIKILALIVESQME